MVKVGRMYYRYFEPLVLMIFAPEVEEMWGLD